MMQTESSELIAGNVLVMLQEPIQHSHSLVRRQVASDLISTNTTPQGLTFARGTARTPPIARHVAVRARAHTAGSRTLGRGA